MDRKRKDQFIVVGNGIAGITAASTIRKFNKEASITIITKESHPTYSACILPNYLSGEIKRDTLFIKSLQYYSKNQMSLILSENAEGIDADRRKLIFESGELNFDRS